MDSPACLGKWFSTPHQSWLSFHKSGNPAVSHVYTPIPVQATQRIFSFNLVWFRISKGWCLGDLFYGEPPLLTKTCPGLLMGIDSWVFCSFFERCRSDRQARDTTGLDQTRWVFHLNKDKKRRGFSITMWWLLSAFLLPLHRKSRPSFGRLCIWGYYILNMCILEKTGCMGWIRALT